MVLQPCHSRPVRWRRRPVGTASAPMLSREQAPCRGTRVEYAGEVARQTVRPWGARQRIESVIISIGSVGHPESTGRRWPVREASIWAARKGSATDARWCSSSLRCRRRPLREAATQGNGCLTRRRDSALLRNREASRRQRIRTLLHPLGPPFAGKTGSVGVDE